jgi:hypothetical protein
VSNDAYSRAGRNYLFQFDATTWGWIHLLVGLLVAFAGWGLLPVLVAADHHPGHLRDLGGRRPRREPTRAGLSPVGLGVTRSGEWQQHYHLRGPSACPARPTSTRRTP